MPGSPESTIRPWHVLTASSAATRGITIGTPAPTASSCAPLHVVGELRGDLGSVTDPVSNTSTFDYSTFDYSAWHDLLDIVEPRRVRAIRNEYDAHGRLIKHIDADGHEIVYSHNCAENTQEIEEDSGLRM